METHFRHLHFTGRDVRGHMIISPQMKIQHHAWAKEETEYFLPIITEKKNVIERDCLLFVTIALYTP